MAPRRRVLSTLAAGAAVAYALSAGVGFVGSQGRDSGSLIAARVGVEYLNRQGPRDADAWLSLGGCVVRIPVRDRKFLHTVFQLKLK